MKQIDVVPFYQEQWFLLVLGAFLTAIGYYIQKWIDTRPKRRKEAQSKDHFVRLKAVSAILGVMRKTQEDIKEIDAVTLIEIGNGGGITKPGSPIYARLIQYYPDNSGVKSVQDDAERIMNQYEKFEIDEEYINMVIYLKETGNPYKFDVATEKSSVLKSIHVAESCWFSEVHHIYYDPEDKKHFILYFTSHTPGESFEDETVQSAIQWNVHYIREMFKRYRG